eukprot:3968579-Prymnesium_polylepis.1
MSAAPADASSAACCSTASRCPRRRSTRPRRAALRAPIQPNEPDHAVQQMLVRLDHNTLLSKLDWADSREADAKAVDDAR